MNHRSTAAALVRAIDNLPNTDQPYHDKEDRALLQQARSNMHKILDKFGYELAPGGKRPLAIKYTKAEKALIEVRRKRLVELWNIALNSLEDGAYRIAKIILNSKYANPDYQTLDAAVKFAVDGMNGPFGEEVNYAKVRRAVELSQEIQADEEAEREERLKKYDDKE